MFYRKLYALHIVFNTVEVSVLARVNSIGILLMSWMDSKLLMIMRDTHSSY